MRFYSFASCGQYGSEERYWTIPGPVQKKIVRNFGLLLFGLKLEINSEGLNASLVHNYGTVRYGTAVRYGTVLYGPL